MATETEQTVKQWLMTLANTDISTEKDESLMMGLLHKCGFPKAIVTCGIVYLEGQGTIDCPPMPINQIAKEILIRQPS